MSLWTQQPTADELLDRRLTSGWVPVPTRMRDGDKILGHAACRYTPK
ncbi:MAG TPA: hypothetical protein VKA60_19725 [Blastocatellia bacterium]|nr:hypothetical protein [Blastocatellia bacterium]